MGAEVGRVKVREQPVLFLQGEVVWGVFGDAAEFVEEGLENYLDWGVTLELVFFHEIVSDKSQEVEGWGDVEDV